MHRDRKNLTTLSGILQSLHTVYSSKTCQLKSSKTCTSFITRNTSSKRSCFECIGMRIKQLSWRTKVMQIVNAVTEPKTEKFILHLFGRCVWLTKDITRAVCCYSSSCQCPIYLNTKTSSIFEYTALPHNNKTRKDPTLSPTRQFTHDSIINQSFRVHARRHPTLGFVTEELLLYRRKHTLLACSDSAFWCVIKCTSLSLGQTYWPVTRKNNV